MKDVASSLHRPHACSTDRRCSLFKFYAAGARAHECCSSVVASFGIN